MPDPRRGATMRLRTQAAPDLAPRQGSEVTGVQADALTAARAIAVPGSFAESARELPADFVRWQLDSRLAMLERIAGNEEVLSFGAHLPVLVTHREAAAFPSHTANKGAGFTPTDEFLDHYVRHFRDALAFAEGKPYEETRAARLAAIRLLYDHPERMDLRRLGMLEIFQGQTYRNIQDDPRVALHYTDIGPGYRSYQVNGRAELVGPGDPRFEFLLAARLLFEFERFHIQQPAYPCGYLLWAAEVIDKSPHHGRAGRIVAPAPAPSSDGFLPLPAPSAAVPSAAVPSAAGPSAAGPSAPAPATGPASGTPPVGFRDVLVALDNSRYSAWCADLALQIAGRFDSTVVGSHVYAARLHDRRFNEMEQGLPERYRATEKLAHQRKVHDTLITKGLRLISDSYLGVLARRCDSSGLTFVGKPSEGTNHAELVRDINATRYDLVVIGARGLGEAGAPLGSVCERVLRNARADVLVVKDERQIEGSIVVAIDGSPHSFGALRVAAALASRLGIRLEAVAAFDPHFHRRAFGSLEGVLSEEAGRVFRFKEQERLHEEIIDSGIAKIYRDHLETARRIAADEDLEIETTLLEGKPYPAILAHLARLGPSLLAVGRTGVHASDGLDIGSNAENLARLAPCHVLVVARAFAARPVRPSEDGAAELSWTGDALARFERVPEAVRGFARKAIEDFARAEGHARITASVMQEARDRMGMP